MNPPFKLGDLVTPVASMQAIAGWPKGSKSFWSGVPGLVVRVAEGGVDVFSCGEMHRHIKFGFVELFNNANNN